MKVSGFAKRALLVGAVVGFAGAARAETWVDAGHTTEVDVDSIKKDADGIVTYMQRDKYGDDLNDPIAPGRAAVDCTKRLAYSRSLIESNPDWRKKGVKVHAGSMGEELLAFVCARVK